MGYLLHNLVLAPRHTKKVAYNNIGSPSVRVRSTYLAFISANSDSTGVGGAQEGYQVDLQAMENCKRRLQYAGRAYVAIPGGP